MKIEIHIERLILDGMPADGIDAGMVSEAVRGELGRLLADGGMDRDLAAGGTFASVRAKPIIGIETRPHALGVQIAKAIHGGLGDQKGATT